jgi:uncharacterized SAM-binding protein YcdF (DUF218 family)
MSLIGPLKPLLTALVMPPAGPLVLILLGGLLARTRRRWAWGLVGMGAVMLWVLSCQATAYGLNQRLLATYPPVSTAQLKDSQAIVVLGGGVKLKAPEYGEPILAHDAHMRLRYGIHLARQTQLPLVYSGGKGWAAPSQQTLSEAAVAARVLQLDAGMRFAWVDEQSRDTQENAELSYAQLAPKGITRIALVTNDWHMQRSLRHFEQAGFVVHPAPMGYVQPPLRWETDYLPSGHGLSSTRQVLREWLGQVMDRLH